MATAMLDFEVPIQIGSDDFILQIGNIKNIEVIDMNSGSIIDDVNGDQKDRQFFKNVFDSVNKNPSVGKNSKDVKPIRKVHNFDK